MKGKLIRSTKVSAAVGRDKLKGWCTQSNVLAYYTGLWPFNNIVRHALWWETGTYSATTLWPDTIASGGGSARLWVIQEGQEYVPPGDYVVSTNSGAYCTIDGNSAGLTAISDGSSGGRKTALFTIPASGLPDRGYGGVKLRINVINGTGSAIHDVSDLYVGLVANEATYRAGTEAINIFDPDFLAQMSGVHSIRFNDWLGRNTGISPFLTDDLSYAISVEGNMLWGSGKQEFKMPPSVCAKLAKYLDCVCWLSVPVGIDNRAYISTAPSTFTNTTYCSDNLPTRALGAEGTYAVVPHGFVENDIVVGYQSGFNEAWPSPLTNETVLNNRILQKYYVHVLNSTQYQLSKTPSGTILTFTESKSYGFVHKQADPRTYWTAFMQQAVTAYPTGTFLLEVSNEWWNSGYSNDFFFSGAGHAAPNGPGEYGTRDAAAHSYSYYQLMAWNVVESLVSRIKNLRITIGQDNNSYDTGNRVLDYNDVNAMVATAGTLIKNIADGTAIGNYFGQRKTYRQLVDAGAITWTDAQWLTEAKASTLETGYFLDWAPLIAGSYPLLRLYTYECGWNGEYNSGTGTLTTVEAQAIGLRLLNWLDSASAGDWITYSMTNWFAVNNVQNCNFWRAGQNVYGLPSQSYNIKLFRASFTDRLTSPAWTAGKAWAGP